jgi:cob(I)alamin adenosyltransferase
MKIYTKTGDAGLTSLFGGERVRKDALRIAAYGTVDELNAAIGFAMVTCADGEIRGMLTEIQNVLFVLGSDLATPLSEANAAVPRMEARHVAWLEQGIDALEARLEPIRFFILPGGSDTAARLHLCRTVCRRAERETVALDAADVINSIDIPYLNRLSDFLFVLSRFANRVAGADEVRWQP